MAKISERVQRMMTDFMELHNNGYSIREIAVMHNLSWSTVYKYLQEIADNNNVSRDELLQVIKTRSTENIYHEEARKVRIDVQQLKNDFENARSSIQGICKKIDELITQED